MKSIKLEIPIKFTDVFPNEVVPETVELLKGIDRTILIKKILIILNFGTSISFKKYCDILFKPDNKKFLDEILNNYNSFIQKENKDEAVLILTNIHINLLLLRLAFSIDSIDNHLEQKIIDKNIFLAILSINESLKYIDFKKIRKLTNVKDVYPYLVSRNLPYFDILEIPVINKFISTNIKLFYFRKFCKDNRIYKFLTPRFLEIHNCDSWDVSIRRSTCFIREI